MRKSLREIIVITGPTGIGKTDLSIKIAKSNGFEIISADSRQVYKYMDIGTGKITPEEMNGVKHHLIDIVLPNEDYNAASFSKDAEAIINEKTNIIVVGGTHFYIQALLENFVKAPKGDAEIIDALTHEYKTSPEKVYAELVKEDPEVTEKIHKNDEYRIIRALSVIRTTGKKYSSFKKETIERKYKPKYYILGMDRALLYTRINARVDKMIELGLFNEVEKILNLGFDKNLKSLNTLGYKEVIAFLNSDISKNSAIEKIKKETRNYAKRQLTWLRNLKVDFLDHAKILKLLT